MKKHLQFPFWLFFIFSILIISSKQIKAQQDSTVKDLYDMDLTELMNIRIEVASKKALTARESPGIVTLITSEEIEKSGARDLIDVLNLVPGIQFGTDVQGVVSVISRGMWAHEGKILVLLDGMMMNEMWYATPQFGNHFPVDLIDRVEIIRGPGSAIYGGYAELGVINVITKKGDKLNGGLIAITDGEMNNEFARRNISFAFGKKTNDISFSTSLFYGKGNQSNQDFSDFYGNTFNMAKGNSQANPLMLNMQMSYKNLNIKFLADEYRLTNRTGFLINTPDSVNYLENNFLNYHFMADYTLKVNEKLKITPKVNYIRNHLYQMNEEKTYLISNQDPENYGGLYCNRKVERMIGGACAAYDIKSNINLIAGGDYYYDYGQEYGIGFFDADTAVNAFVPINLSNGKKSTEYYNTSFYFQGLVSTPYVNITGGARYDNHSTFGSAFVPRIALTKAWERFHVKTLYSMAFKAPSIANLDLNDKIKPENTTVIELEAGYKLTEAMYLTANIFHCQITDPIVYGVSDEGEIYINRKSVNTQGFEVDYKFRNNYGFLNLNYSYYMVGKNKVPEYGIPKTMELLDENFTDNQLLEKTMLLGSAKQKIGVLASFKVLENLSINPSVIYLDKRYGFGSVDTANVSLIKEFAPTTLLNFNIEYKNLIIKGFHVSVAVFDILDEQFKYIQPYNGYHAAFPATGREFVIKLKYRFNN